MNDQTDKANLEATGLSDAAKSTGADASKAAAPEPTKGTDAPKAQAEPAKEPTKVKTLAEIARDNGVSERGVDERQVGSEKIGTSDPAALEPFRGGVEDRPRDGASVTDVSSADAKLRQIEETERKKEALNRANREGHEVNMDRIESEGQQAQDASRQAPTSGMEDNRNTPRIAKDGSKHWD